MDEATPRRPTLSLAKKLTFAALTTVTFFVVIELALVALDVRPVTDQGDPFVGFSSRMPLFELAPDDGDRAGDERAMMRTAPGKLIWFNPQTFPQRKPEGTRRVFCLGGSTTYGHPFADSTSFCGWLRRFLPLADSSVQWEVINAGGISYASYRVASLMEEITQYEPDLFIVLSAHNEFLERRTYASMFDQPEWSLESSAILQRSRTWSLASGLVGRSGAMPATNRELLPQEVDEILNHSAGPKDYHRDPLWQDKVLQHYEFNLNRMVAIARDSGAQIVFVSPPSNLRDCSPFKSEHSIQLSDAQRNEFDAMLELAEAELRDENFEQAKHHCEQLLELDASFAQLHFLHGKSLFGLQQWELAEGAFRRALDEDVCPLRATSEIAERIHRVSQRHQVPLVDAEARLRTSSMQKIGHACFGDEYFLDHVHPTIDFNRMIALWILEELHSSGAIDGQLPSDEQIAEVQRNVNATIDGQAQGVAFRNLAKVLHWAGKFDEAIPRAEDALRLLPRDQESRFVLADCRFQIGELGEARQQYDRLFEIGEYSRAYLPFGEVLSELKEYSEAKDYLVRALLSDRQDHRTRAYYLLGLAHLQLGEFDPAVQAFRESDKAFPNDPSTLALISEAELARGDWQSAKRELLRLTAIEPNNYFAHFRLAEILHQKDVNEEAMWHIDQALRCEPANPDAIRQREAIRRALESSNKPGS